MATRLERTRRPHAADRLRWLNVALLSLPVLYLAERAWSRRWMSDDGFITLRVVQQLLDGNGPVFNAGERVEASTSALWTYVLALADLVAPVRLEWIAVLLGIGLTLLGVALATAGATTLLHVDGRVGVLLPAGAAVLAALTPVWTFSSSGLEGGLAFAWLGGCLLVLARWAVGERGLSSPAAVLLGLGPLVRPDLGLFTALFLAGALATQWRGDGWAARFRLLAVALALPVAYQLFRMGYYGSLVPNPAIAKEASQAAWSSGWRYLREATLPYWLWVPVVALLVGGYRPLAASARRRGAWRPLAVLAAFGIGGLAHAAFVTRVGGDFMHARLLLPSIFAVVAPVAAVPVRRLSLPALAVLPWALVAAIGLRASADSVGIFGQDDRTLVTVQDFGWGRRGPNRAWFTGDGAYFGQTRLSAAPNPVHGEAIVAMFGLGIGGYALPNDVYVLDLLGLADVLTSHLELDRRGIVGHEKPLPAPWIAARLTAPGSGLDAEQLPLPTAYGVRALDDPDRAPFDERVAVARAVLRCPEVRELLAASRGRLTPRRFLENVFDAPGNTTLRIPPEPEDARAALC